MEPQFRALEMYYALDQQRCANQQDGRKRDLADDQNTPQAARGSGSHGFTPAAQRTGYVRPRESERRRKSKQDSGENGEGRCESEYDPVGANIVRPRQIDRRDVGNPAQAENRDSQTQKPTSERQQNAFHEQLTGKTPPGSSQSGANGEFA